MPYAQRWVSNKGVDLYVVTEGHPDNPALVLVHGYPDNHSVWDSVTRHLVSHYFVIRYDVRGAGRSTSPARTRDYRVHHLAADLKSVIDAVIPGRSFHLSATTGVRYKAGNPSPPPLCPPGCSPTPRSPAPAWTMSRAGFAGTLWPTETPADRRFSSSWPVPGTCSCSSCR